MKVFPFRAIRPSEAEVEQLACLPYDVMNTQEARAMAQGKPHSFLRVVRSDLLFEDEQDPYEACVYERGREELQRLLEQGVLRRDEKASFYLYRQTRGERKQLGLVACLSSSDYSDGQIKRHELTRSAKELDRIRHFECCQVQTEPVFLAYRSIPILQGISELVLATQAPCYDFVDADGVRQELWVIDDDPTIEAFQKAFERVPSLYIADGHHRTASAAHLAQERAKRGLPDPGLMAVIFPAEALDIMPYNRLVTGLNGLSPEAWLEALAQVMEIEGPFETAVEPSEKGNFGLYFQKKWYRLRFDLSQLDESNLIANLDVSILQDRVLDPILGIKDPRTDSRIDFVGGIRGLQELERRCIGAEDMAFSFYPTSMKELLAVSDAGLIMPPKSTWFEPKLLSGLFLHPHD